ncbi:MAG: hypothetical protein RUMPE_00171 [Eubacteriales bacterium SKADARSKE-1]|nr:hypothetical protein [Eubacteriales bacterium SKADARSKE-1]
MAQIVGVKFKDTGKTYYFDPNGLTVNIGDLVIVDTAKGREIGKVVIENRNIFDKVITDLKKIIRKANAKDLEKLQKNKEKEKKAISICNEKIRKYNLDMKLIDVEYSFDGNKIVFYFTSEARVDFRNLVKELASIFKVRIELRQVGVRDEAKMLGGLGPCGNPLCCATFLEDFQPVSIKMAKEQGLSLNPVKISGTCGRLMCCLKYEQEVYSDLLKKTPKVGTPVSTEMGNGKVKDVNLLARTLKVQLDSKPEAVPVCVNVSDVKVLKK